MLSEVEMHLRNVTNITARNIKHSPIYIHVFSQYKVLEKCEYRHCQRGVEIVYFEKFEGEIVMHGKRYRDLNDKVLLVNMCDTHEIHIMPQEDMHVVHVIYPYYFLTEMIPDIDYYRFVLDYNDISIKNIIKDMEEEYINGDDCSKFKIIGLAYQMLYELMRRYALRTNDKIEDRVWERTIFEYIEENLDQISSVEEIANHFYYAKGAFSRKFRERADISCQKYLLQKRLSRAVELLLHTDLKEETISQRCGFKSVRSFRENFYNTFHHLPEQFRY